MTSLGIRNIQTATKKSPFIHHLCCEMILLFHRQAGFQRHCLALLFVSQANLLCVASVMATSFVFFVLLPSHFANFMFTVSSHHFLSSMQTAAELGANTSRRERKLLEVYLHVFLVRPNLGSRGHYRVLVIIVSDYPLFSITVMLSCARSLCPLHSALFRYKC